MRGVYSNIVDAVLDAQNNARTGVVRFENGKQRKQLVLKNGFVAFAESNVPDEHLARMLMDVGRLQKEDLGRIAAAMKEGKTSDDAVLAVTGLPASAVEAAVREQAVAITASVLQFDGQEFRFYRFESCAHRRIQLQIPPRELVVEAARRAVTLRLLPNRYRDLLGTVEPSPPGAEFRLTLPLNSAEAFAFAELSHHTTIESFRSSFPDLGVPPLELAQRLLLLGLVGLEAPGQSGAPASEPHACGPAESEVTALLERYEGANHYEVLSVPNDASQDQIRAAYHDLARRYHPDRFQSSSHTAAVRDSVDRLFARVTGAYSNLADSSLRSQYDADIQKKQESPQPKGGRPEPAQEKEKTAEALFRAGGNAMAVRDFEKAAQLFLDCVWLQPDVAKYQLALGLAQMEVPRRRKDAEQSLLAALRLEPASVGAHLALARLYVTVNLPRRAEARAQEALHWDPANREAQELLNAIAARGR